MSLEKRIKQMLFTHPNPKKIKKGITFVLLKTFLTPGGSFCTHSEKKLSLALYAHARKFFKYPQSGVFLSLFAPIELIHAFNLFPFSLEILAAIAASMGLAPDLLTRAEKEWLSSDFCSFHRTYLELARTGLLPKPLFCMATSHTCDGTFKSFSRISEHFSTPFIFLNTPYHEDSPAVKYLSLQIESAVRRIEEITGRSLRASDLERAFYYSNRAREALLEINALKKNSAPLIYGEESLVFVLIMGTLLGSRAGASVFESYRKEVKYRADNRFNKINGKKRILWLHLKPFYPSILMRYLERDLGAVIVAEEINSVYWDELDPGSPWESLARKLMSNLWVGGIEKRLNYIRRTIENYEIDGVIHFSHWGCRQSGGAVRLIKDTVMEYGIPFLNLDGDCIDGRNYSEAQYITRLEGFMEILG